MGTTRFGTVGYSYRDWAGIFFPPGTPPRRQFNIYAQHFDVCELSQFTHQMPDPERMVGFAAQIRTDLRLFVRIHNTFTHCADIGLALTIARHFRKAMEPLREAGKLWGLVAPFPYAFKSSKESRDYVEQLASALHLDDQTPLQLDFRHGSWHTEESLDWMRQRGLGLVLVDEPRLPGLVPSLVAATAERVLVRLHGRNGASWWSGNQATRYDYLYSPSELDELRARYAPLSADGTAEVAFLFSNNWQAQSVTNAAQFRTLHANEARPETDSLPEALPVPMPFPMPSPTASPIASDEEDDACRPPTSLPLSEVKSRVSRALQESLDLPPRS